jgi:hypothetical protein
VQLLRQAIPAPEGGCHVLFQVAQRLFLEARESRAVESVHEKLSSEGEAMTLSPKVKTVLDNMTKNAVNAALTALGPISLWSSQFNFHNWTGGKHVLFVMGSAALAREVMVYAPKVMAWSQTTNGAAH